MVLRAITVGLLLLVSLGYLAVFLDALLTDPNGLLPHMIAGLPLVGLWLLVAVAARNVR